MFTFVQRISGLEPKKETGLSEELCQRQIQQGLDYYRNSPLGYNVSEFNQGFTAYSPKFNHSVTELYLRDTETPTSEESWGY